MRLQITFYEYSYHITGALDEVAGFSGIPSIGSRSIVAVSGALRLGPRTAGIPQKPYSAKHSHTNLLRTIIPAWGIYDTQRLRWDFVDKGKQVQLFTRCTAATRHTTSFSIGQS